MSEPPTMTVLSNISKQTGARTAEEAMPAASRARLDVRWTVDRVALRRARPGLVDPGSTPIELRWLIQTERGRVEASASVVDADHTRGTRVTPLLESRSDLLHPPPVWIDDGQMVHVDLPGLVVVSLRLERDGTRLLYARTRVLEDLLALPGGRYEPTSAVHSRQRPI